MVAFRWGRMLSGRLWAGSFVLLAFVTVFACSKSESPGPVTGGGGDGRQCGAEQCDGLDNDCDGRVDEDCPCASGDQQACFSGNPIHAAIGVCAYGSQSCMNDAWGECVGEVLAADEICGDGFDQDCDGEVDDGCPCAGSETQACYSGNPITVSIGQCVRGTQACQGETWGSCAGDITPDDEQCDGLDNDCDGQADEGCGGAGGTGGAGGAPPQCDESVSADFSQATIAEDGISISVFSGFNYNATYGSWEYDYPNGPLFQGQFSADPATADATLSVTHLTALLGSCQGNGYAPITITLNGTDVVTNYDVAENHGGSHAMQDDQWQIGSLLQQGANTISWSAQDTCSKYRILSLEITWSTCSGTR